jgi:hypothetical protein
MRGMLAGLVVALIIVLVALLVATLGAVGVAAIGLLLHRWFDLTQWQGSLIALAVALGVGFVTFRMASVSDTSGEPEWMEWEDGDEEDEIADQPPIVPWRRQRPTQGELPSERPQQQGSRRK